MATFIWKPATGASLSAKPSVDVSKFGDGYEQRVGSGINGQPRKWSLKFTSSVTTVLAFVEAQAGEFSFDWTDPLGRAGKWVCREWKVNHVGGLAYDLSCDFEQVPA